jgi:hypothetical protein
MGGFGGGGFGIGLGLVLGTGAGVKLTPGVVPVESLLPELTGTGLFLAIGPALRVLHPLISPKLNTTATQSPKTDFFMNMICLGNT